MANGNVFLSFFFSYRQANGQKDMAKLYAPDLSLLGGWGGGVHNFVNKLMITCHPLLLNNLFKFEVDISSIKRDIRKKRDRFFFYIFKVKKGHKCGKNTLIVACLLYRFPPRSVFTYLSKFEVYKYISSAIKRHYTRRLCKDNSSSPHDL